MGLSTKSLIALCAWAIIPASFAVPAAAQAQQAAVPAAAVERISGSFADGTGWLVQMPPNWNGTLIVDLDGAGFRMPAPPPGFVPPAGAAMPPRDPSGMVQRVSPFNEWLLAQGYALGGTTREPVGYDFLQAVENLLAVRGFAQDRWGATTRTLVSGGSRGAFVVRKSLELYPEIFDGGIVSAGGGAGEIAVLRNKLNGVFVLKTLVNPASPMTLVNVNVATENAALGELIALAASTPQGRARLALAGAVQQFSLWSSRSAPRPAPGDYATQVDQMAANFQFATAVPVRAGVEALAGGNVSWNTDADYAALLAGSGRQEMVEALYAAAGISLADDLAALARAPRISADPAAVARAEPYISYTGAIADPLINIDNDDPVDPASDKLAYVETLRRAGTDGYFRLLWSDQAGHGGQTDMDRAVAFTMLEDRLETGFWGDLSLWALRDLAEEIVAETSINLGELTLFDPGPLPEPANIWDATNWGTYRPAN